MPQGFPVTNVAGARIPTFKRIGEVAQAFEISIAAAIIRVAEVNSLPIIVALYDRKGIRWRPFAAHVPRRRRLVQALNEDGFAYDIVNGVASKQCFGRQEAQAWFRISD